MIIYDMFLQYLATMAENACYDCSGTASRISICEPEMPTEVKDWKKTHISLMERLSKSFLETE